MKSLHNYITKLHSISGHEGLEVQYNYNYTLSLISEIIILGY